MGFFDEDDKYSGTGQYDTGGSFSGSTFQGGELNQAGGVKPFAGLFRPDESLISTMKKDSLVDSMLRGGMINPKSVQPSFAEDIRSSFSGGLARPRRPGRRQQWGRRYNLGTSKGEEDESQW